MCIQTLPTHGEIPDPVNCIRSEVGATHLQIALCHSRANLFPPYNCCRVNLHMEVFYSGLRRLAVQKRQPNLVMLLLLDSLVGQDNLGPPSASRN